MYRVHSLIRGRPSGECVVKPVPGDVRGEKGNGGSMDINQHWSSQGQGQKHNKFETQAKPDPGYDTGKQEKKITYAPRHPSIKPFTVQCMKNIWGESGQPRHQDAVNCNKKRKAHLQIRARMSPLPVANRLFVGLGATEITVKVSTKPGRGGD